MGFNFTKTEIPDVVLIKFDVFGDDRGFFIETYKQSAFEKAGIKYKFMQDNHSKSQRGVLRGLHFQRAPTQQGKLVRVLKGEIWDVAVDIRKGSPTYGKWVATTLSEENKTMVFIPPDFAHGFVAMRDGTEVVYKTTNEYSKDDEGGIIWNDPTLKIPWPIKDPSLSEKDTKWPTFDKL